MEAFDRIQVVSFHVLKVYLLSNFLVLENDEFVLGISGSPPPCENLEGFSNLTMSMYYHNVEPRLPSSPFGPGENRIL